MIKNVEDLRNHVLESLIKLENREIDVAEAGIIAKSSETVMSSLKMQLAYSNMIGERPNIEFLQDCHQGTPINLLEGEV